MAVHPSPVEAMLEAVRLARPGLSFIVESGFGGPPAGRNSSPFLKPHSGFSAWDYHFVRSSLAWGQHAGHGRHPNARCARAEQYPRTFENGGSGRKYIVHQQHVSTGDSSTAFNRKCAPDV